MKPGGAIHSLAEFYAHALALENEASARYQELGDQMAVHHNRATAELFFWLSRIEGEHADQIAARARGTQLPVIQPWDYQWVGLESPESAAYDSASYLMTPYQALEIALENEKRAAEFFETVAKASRDPSVRELAEEMAAEERKHVEYVRRAMAGQAPPEPDWDADLNPPQEPE
jgi:rubrerythrin